MPMPMKQERARFTLPAWLEPQTVAILGTLLTVGIGVGALVQTSFTGLRDEMKEMRQELNAKIGRLDDRLRAVEIDVAAIRTSVLGLEARVRIVEEHARHPIEALPPRTTES